jgi:glycosyltransferase involved in cell wall biosynthesis
MYKGKKIAALIPAYNEEKLIDKVLSNMPSFVDYMIVIDDASKDRTSEKVRQFQKSASLSLVGARGHDTFEEEKITLIRHAKNTGLGGAIRTATKKAKELGAEIGVVMAGDNQMDPSYLPALLDPICEKNYDFTKANRFYGSDGYESMPN